LINYFINLYPLVSQTLHEMSGPERNSGVMMWPGSEFSYHKAVLPTFIHKWDPKWSWQQRVDMVIKWLNHPEKPANLVMLYMEEPDTHAHAFGSESPEVTEQIKNVDKSVLNLTNI